MVFNSLPFLLFLVSVLCVFYVIPRRIRVYWLLLASYYFYAFWNVKCTLLLLLSTVVTFFCGIVLEKVKNNSLKKVTVAVNLSINLGILALFKYLPFFVNNLNKLLNLFGDNSVSLGFSLVLPVGISFYTFQAIGYTIDVYRGDISAETNFAKYALFVSFFPQLVAGPIERSKNLLSQIDNLKKKIPFDIQRFEEGAFVALYGFVMKMIVADRIAIIVTNVYDKEIGYSFYGLQLVFAAILFSIQIFCDFAGYTYIAIGVAEMLGIRLCNNFNAPYLSGSIKEFWCRWHISLSSWFKDYLYIPLGGNKKGKIRKYLNLLFVFLVSGLWHGASWHYVVWGGLHGLTRVIEEALSGVAEKAKKLIHYKSGTFSSGILCEVWTFSLVTLFWVFFRANSTNQAIDVIKRMFVNGGWWQLTDGSLLNMGLDGKELNVLFLFISLILVVDILLKRGRKVAFELTEQNVWFRFAVFLFGIISVVIFGVYGADYNASQFIYFQF